MHYVCSPWYRGAWVQGFTLRKSQIITLPANLGSGSLPSPSSRGAWELRAKSCSQLHQRGSARQQLGAGSASIPNSLTVWNWNETARNLVRREHFKSPIVVISWIDLPTTLLLQIKKGRACIDGVYRFFNYCFHIILSIIQFTSYFT